jgi:preprotein translocase subunit SecE
VRQGKETSMADEERGGSAIAEFAGETRAELRKVIWPTRQEATNLTIVVVAVTAAMTVFLSSIDWLFSEAFRFALSLVGG